MSRFIPINIDEQGHSPRWYDLPRTYLSPPDSSYLNTPSTVAVNVSSSAARVLTTTPPLTPDQAPVAASTGQSAQQIEHPWERQVFRGHAEPLNLYIARMEAECSNHPRPAQSLTESREEYASRLYLRVYNKYCKRRQRRNEQADKTGNGDNQRRRGRIPRRTEPYPTELSRSNQQQVSICDGHNNGQQQSPLDSHNEQERRGTDPSSRLQAQAAAGARLEQHITERTLQGVNMEQFFRLTLNLPLDEMLYEESTMRFHRNFSNIATFPSTEGDGARMILRSDLPNGRMPMTPPMRDYTSGSDTPASSASNILTNDKSVANDDSGGQYYPRNE